MIKFKNVNFKYSSKYDNNGIQDLNFNINKGEFIVLCGKSGCGKTTVTRLINGLIPHFYEGDLSGEVFVNGQNMAEVELSDMASTCASVFQNPKSQFFNLDTTGELAFGCENLNWSKEEIADRIERTVNDFSLKELMDRNIFELSGGEKQQIACGSVYATDPEVYIFDEPSSNMDAKAIDRFKKILTKLKNQGKTIVVSEHRLYYLTELADKYLYFEKGELKNTFLRDEFLKMQKEELFALGLRHTNLENIAVESDYVATNEDNVITFENIICTKNDKNVLDMKSFSVNTNDIVAVIGENGSGKTTFSEVASGLIKNKGDITLQGEKIKGKKLTQKSYIVMQDVNRQLFCATVKEELSLGIKNRDENFDKIMQKMLIKEFEERHPGSLSGGQKQRVAICSAIAAKKEIMFYDEPTSGLDYEGMNNFCEVVKENRNEHLVTMIITHDLELVLGCCTRVLHLEKGRVLDSYPIDEEGIVRLKNYFIHKTR